ncbi:hypothetical protein K4H03_26035, partial [Mycobacterium tuberculosis]|nr:hypothetical protein [Mycobacterium tuberculosis]
STDPGSIQINSTFGTSASWSEWITDTYEIDFSLDGRFFITFEGSELYSGASATVLRNVVIAREIVADKFIFTGAHDDILIASDGEDSVT